MNSPWSDAAAVDATAICGVPTYQYEERLLRAASNSQRLRMCFSLSKRAKAAILFTLCVLQTPRSALEAAVALTSQDARNALAVAFPPAAPGPGSGKQRPPPSLDNPKITRTTDYITLEPLAMSMASAGLCAEYPAVVKCLLWADVGRVALSLLKKALELGALREGRGGDWLWVVQAEEGTSFASPASVEAWLEAGRGIGYGQGSEAPKGHYEQQKQETPERAGYQQLHSQHPPLPSLATASRHSTARTTHTTAMPSSEMTLQPSKRVMGRIEDMLSDISMPWRTSSQRLGSSSLAMLGVDGNKGKAVPDGPLSPTTTRRSLFQVLQESLDDETPTRRASKAAQHSWPRSSPREKPESSSKQMDVHETGNASSSKVTTHTSTQGTSASQKAPKTPPPRLPSANTLYERRQHKNTERGVATPGGAQLKSVTTAPFPVGLPQSPTLAMQCGDWAVTATYNPSPQESLSSRHVREAKLGDLATPTRAPAGVSGQGHSPQAIPWSPVAMPWSPAPGQLPMWSPAQAPLWVPTQMPPWSPMAQWSPAAQMTLGGTQMTGYEVSPAVAPAPSGTVTLNAVGDEDHMPVEQADPANVGEQLAGPLRDLSLRQPHDQTPPLAAATSSGLGPSRGSAVQALQGKGGRQPMKGEGQSSRSAAGTKAEGRAASGMSRSIHAPQTFDDIFRNA